MPFSTTSIVSGPYTPNGVTTTFPFLFRALSAAEVEVVVISSTGVETVLEGYTVNGVMAEGGGGSVVFASAPSYSGQQLYVRANPTFTQPVTFENQGSWNPEDLDVALDRDAQRALYLLANGGGGGQVAGSWTTLEDKPANLTALAALSGLDNRLPYFTGAGAMALTTFSAFGRTLVATNDAEAARNALGISSEGGTATAWSDISEKPASVTALAGVIGASDRLPYFTGASAMAVTPLTAVARNLLAAATQTEAREAIGATAGDAAGGGPYPLLSDFGSIDGGGVQTAANTAALEAAELSDERRIWLPEGTYAVAKTQAEMRLLTKRYEGPGKFLATSGYRAFIGLRNYSYVSAELTSRVEYGRDRDTNFSDIGQFVLGEGSRVNFDRYLSTEANPAGYGTYFWAPATPFFNMQTNRAKAGWSGLSGKLAANVSAGATSAQIASGTGGYGVAGWGVGQTVGFTPGTAIDGAPTDIVVITAISGDVITFTPALANSYVAGEGVSHGYRTMNTMHFALVEHEAGGDAYAWCARMIAAYQPLNSQRNFVETATVGIIGGDITFSAPGNYATGWECQYIDQGFDSAVIARVESYVRQNNTADRGVVWLHDYAKMDGGGTSFTSFGLKRLDGVWRCQVGARTGLDMTGSTFSVAAVAIPLGQRIGFDCEVVAPDATNGNGWVATTFNDMYMAGESDVVGKYLYLRAGSAGIAMRVGGTIAMTGNVGVTGGVALDAGVLSVGGNQVVGPRLGSIPDCTLDLSSVAATLNALLAGVRTHGLFAS